MIDCSYLIIYNRLICSFDLIIFLLFHYYIDFCSTPSHNKNINENINENHIEYSLTKDEIYQINQRLLNPFVDSSAFYTKKKKKNKQRHVINHIIIELDDIIFNDIIQLEPIILPTLKYDSNTLRIAHFCYFIKQECFYQKNTNENCYSSYAYLYGLVDNIKLYIYSKRTDYILRIFIDDSVEYYWDKTWFEIVKWMKTYDFIHLIKVNVPSHRNNNISYGHVGYIGTLFRYIYTKDKWSQGN